MRFLDDSQSLDEAKRKSTVAHDGDPTDVVVVVVGRIPAQVPLPIQHRGTYSQHTYPRPPLPPIITRGSNFSNKKLINQPTNKQTGPPPLHSRQTHLQPLPPPVAQIPRPLLGRRNKGLLPLLRRPGPKPPKSDRMAQKVRPRGAHCPR